MRDYHVLMVFCVLMLTACAADTTAMNEGESTADHAPLIYSSPQSHVLSALTLNPGGGVYNYPADLIPHGGFMEGDESNPGPWDGFYAVSWISELPWPAIHIRIVAGMNNPLGMPQGTVYNGADIQVSSGIGGMAATEVRPMDGEGTNVLFSYVDPSTDTVHVIEVSRFGSISSPVTVYSSGFGGSVSDIAPTLESGVLDDEERILLAFNGVSGFVTNIRYGFLERSGSSWAFSTKGLLNPSSDPSLPCGRWQGPNFITASPQLFYNIDSVFSHTDSEWSLTWICNGDPAINNPDWTVEIQRLDWDGTTLHPNPYPVVSHPFDPLHSGVMLSYNDETGIWLLQVQHNLRQLERSGSSWTCLDIAGNPVGFSDCSANAISDLMPNSSSGRLAASGSGITFASEVFYSDTGSTEFRVAGQCSNTGGMMTCGTANHQDGVSFERRIPGATPSGFEPEVPSRVWDSAALGPYGVMWRVIRGPADETALFLHMVPEDPSSSDKAFVAATFGSESPSFPYYR